MLSAEGLPVRLTGRGAVSAEPVRVRVADRTSSRPGDRRTAGWSTDLVVDAWAGPWPIDELWWDPSRARHVARFQIVGVDGSAWLMIIEGTQWWTEAQYV